MKNFNLKVFIVTLLLQLGVVSLFAQTSSITIDSTFGTNGVTSNYAAANYNEHMADMAIQPDGKIVVVGGSGNASGQPTVIRFLSTGVVDSSFGTGGYVFLGQAYDLQSGAGGVKLLSNGKILVSGNDDYPPGVTNFVARLDSNGVIDSSFGTDGYTYFLQGKNLLTPLMVVLSDGSIITEYSSGTYQSVLVKIDSNGVKDSTFGINDSLFISELSQINNLALDNNGNILAASGASDTEAIGVLRILPDGHRDSTFGVNGLALYSYYDSSTATYASVGSPIVAVLPNGNMLVTFNTYQVVGTFRLLTNGSLDGSYGNNGLAFSLSYVQNTAVQLMSNDELVITGYFDYSSYVPVGEMAVLTASGQVDTVLEPGNKPSIIFVLDTSATNSDSQPDAIRLLPGNKLLVGGTAVPSLNVIGFARFNYTGFIATGINQVAPADQPQLYPNPANNYAMIAYPFAEMKDANIKVFDMMGKLVLSNTITSRSSLYRVDAGSLCSGVYLVQIRSGNQLSTSKLVVQH